MTEGITFCLLTSFLWALSSLYATEAVRSLGAQTYNCLRLVLGSLLLWLVFIISKSFVLPSLYEMLLISASAIVGLSFGDMFLFKGFDILGSRRSTLVFMLNIPMTTFLSFLMFGEKLSVREVIGGTVAVVGIAIAANAGKKDLSGRTQVDNIQGKMWKGICFCLVAAACQSIGLLTLKPVLNLQVYSAMQIAAMRFSLAGIVTLFMAYRFGLLKQINLNAQSKALYYALFAILTGGVIGFICYITGISKVPATYAALFTSLSPLFVLPLLVIYNKKWPAPMAWVGASVGIGGIFLCLLR